MSACLHTHGTTLWLLSDGAVWWPERRVLWVADLHLGKGQAFRRQGHAVPTGDSERTLHRLEGRVQLHGAEQVVVLGDLWHSAQGLTPALLDRVHAFAQRVPTAVVLGNHDRPIHPRGLALTVWPDAQPVGPLRACHEPPEHPDPTGITLAGHLHPAVALSSRAGDRLRRPCFWHRNRTLVLPAFGGLTGAHTLTEAERRSSSVAVLGDHTVHWLHSA